MSIDMWTEMLKNFESLYVIDSIDMFVDEDALESMKRQVDPPSISKDGGPSEENAE